MREATNLGAPGLGSGITVWQGVVIELVLTFFLVWVIFATAADPGGTFKAIAGLGIGLTITIDVLMGGPLTGAAMNPARAFGPELLSRDWTDGRNDTLKRIERLRRWQSRHIAGRQNPPPGRDTTASACLPIGGPNHCTLGIRSPIGKRHRRYLFSCLAASFVKTRMAEMKLRCRNGETAVVA